MMLLAVAFAAFLHSVHITYADLNQTNRILGGTEAMEGQFPYQVYITRYGKPHCGGSILDRETILTAAHCALSFNVYFSHVIVGTNSLASGGIVHRITRLTSHQDYNPYLITNDIAVIKVTPPITFNDRVKPVKLRSTKIDPDKTVTVSGWGYRSFPGRRSTKLHWVVQKTVDLMTCREQEQGELVLHSELCTLSVEGEGACKGDSGGPLVDDNKELVGIVSWSFPCATGTPDVSTHVWYFRKWIEENR